MSPESKFTLVLVDAESTVVLGAELALWLQVCDFAPVIWLEGDLGAGKTTLARGLLRAAGVNGTVRSPTYTLVEMYTELSLGKHSAIAHMDLYRLSGGEEIEYLGLEDLHKAGTIQLIEWPAQGGVFTPTADLRILLTVVDNGREVQLSGPASAAFDRFRQSRSH